LAATDAESHMEVLQAMSELFESQESTKKVLDASNEKEIYDLFVKAV
jgi:PTS system ascorbate-specific IIA component